MMRSRIFGEMDLGKVTFEWGPKYKKREQNEYEECQEMRDGCNLSSISEE